VTVSNGNGSVTSANATLTVGGSPAGPVITTQPANLTVSLGAAATFTVAATGATPMTYQWYAGTDPIAGATAASYTTPATIPSDNGATFHVVVRNAAGSATSNDATLTIGAGPVAKDLIHNGGFESGATAWTAPSGVIGQFGSAYAGTWNAWLSRRTLGWSRSGQISQTVTIPASATQAILAFQLHVTGGSSGTLRAQVRNASGQVLATLGTFGDGAAASGYQAHSFNLSAFKGQTIQVTFAASLGSVWRSRTWTSFLLDNVSLNAKF
jgi:hypothetical protein